MEEPMDLPSPLGRSNRARASACALSSCLVCSGGRFKLRDVSYVQVSLHTLQVTHTQVPSHSSGPRRPGFAPPWEAFLTLSPTGLCHHRFRVALDTPLPQEPLSSHVLVQSLSREATGAGQCGAFPYPSLGSCQTVL